MGRFWQVIPALLLAFAPAAANADERILRYLSDVQVQRDSSIEVTETIDVNVEHRVHAPRNDRVSGAVIDGAARDRTGASGAATEVGFARWCPGYGP